MASQPNVNKSINDAIGALNKALQSSENSTGTSKSHSNLGEALKNVVSERLHKLDDLKESAQKSLETGKAKAKQMASQIDESVHSEPWKYLGATAVGALIVGFLLGKSRKG